MRVTVIVTFSLSTLHSIIGTLFAPLTITSESTIRQWIITNHTVSPADVQTLNGQIRQLMRAGQSEEALKGALENAPYGADEQGKVGTRAWTVKHG